MQQSELKHTLSIKRDAWFVRFYLWLYQADPKDVDFCKLFWGILLSPIWLIGASIILPIGYVAVWLHDRYSTDAESVEVKQQTRAHRRQRGLRFVDLVESLVSRLVFAVTSMRGLAPVRLAARAVSATYSAAQRVLVPAAALLATAVVAFVVYEAVTHLSLTALALVSLAALVLLSALLAYLYVTGFFSTVYVYALSPLGNGVKGGTLGFFGVLRTGYRSIKTNTCPRVELK